MTIVLAFLAGLVSILAPCVLPLVPIIFGTAASRHRFGPLALAGGVTLSFVAVGTFAATVGFAAGVNTEVVRMIAAALMIAAGAVMLLPSLQSQFAIAAGPVTNWAQSHLQSVQDTGWRGQFVVGLMLGAVWAPCVGPTLGAASVLAAQGENLGMVALTMTAFGVGAALPMILLGVVSRNLLARRRSGFLSAGRNLKMFVACALVVVGVLILTGYDKVIESMLVACAPDWLNDLTTRF